MDTKTCLYDENMSAKEIAKLKQKERQRIWYERNKIEIRKHQLEYYHAQQKVNRKVLYDFYMKYHDKILELEKLFSNQKN